MVIALDMFLGDPEMGRLLQGSRAENRELAVSMHTLRTSLKDER